MLTAALLPKGGALETLVTKVMLGVWGVIPAFDYFLEAAFRYLSENRKEQAAFNSPREPSLGILLDFYAEHAEKVDKLAEKLRTVDFVTGQSTDQLATRMKVIDMFAFQVGFDGASKVLGPSAS